MFSYSGQYSTSFEQNSSFKIGVIGSFSGASVDFGHPMLKGIKLAVDKINVLSGFVGRRLYIDRPVEEIGEIIKASLEAGQIVALDTSGGEVNQQKIQELTLEYGSMGVLAEAVMLYQSAAGAEVSVLPYDAADKRELASLMSVVGRCSAGNTRSQ